MRSVSSGVGKPHSALSAQRDRVVEAAVGEDGVAVAQLLARPVELVGAEALVGGAPAGVLDGAREAVARGCARRWRPTHGAGPVGPPLEMGADLVAEAEPLAQLLEEPAVGIGADDVDRDAGREQRRAATAAPA